MYRRVKSGVQSQPRPYNRIIHVIHALIAEGTRRQQQHVTVQGICTETHMSKKCIHGFNLQRLSSDFVKFLFADYKIKRLTNYTSSEIREITKNM